MHLDKVAAVIAVDAVVIAIGGNVFPGDVSWLLPAAVFLVVVMTGDVLREDVIWLLIEAVVTDVVGVVVVVAAAVVAVVVAFSGVQSSGAGPPLTGAAMFLCG